MIELYCHYHNHKFLLSLPAEDGPGPGSYQLDSDKKSVAKTIGCRLFVESSKWLFSVHFTLSVSLMRKHVGMLFLVLGMRRLSGYQFAQFW